MLVQLSVRDFVLFDAVTFELSPGFNVLTGETGAGKSLVVDALGLILGARARPELVRTGAPHAEVEALFDVTKNSSARALLADWGVLEGSELVIRRTVSAEGRSRAHANGRILTAAQLNELAPHLCDVASQHESVALTNPATHLLFLDAYAALDADRVALGELVERLALLVREADRAKEDVKRLLEREDYLRFQDKEFEALEPVVGEDDRLRAERVRLRHAERLLGATRGAAEWLDDAEGAATDVLARVTRDVEGAAAIDETLEPLAVRLRACSVEIADIAHELARYGEGVDASPQRLEQVEERLFRIERLLKKHGPTLADAQTARANIRSELEAIEHADEKDLELASSVERELAACAKQAEALHGRRKLAAAKLGEAIGKELAKLGMGRAKVEVSVELALQGASKEAALVVNGARLSKAGIDRVEFLLAPNPGEEPRPLRKIASGGELSRALLALKRVLASNGPAGLYVFDEVDAGTSGAVAEAIGLAMADVAEHRQVLCITHLPQIAALADAQYVVGKEEVAGRTTSHVRRLRKSERVAEIAKLIGGARIGDAAKRAAREMLAQANGRAA